MGKITRRGTIAAAVASAAALALAPAAMAADDGVIIDPDTAVSVGQDLDPTIYRLAGADRIGTSVEAAERVSGVWGNTVIIASNQVFADALAAGPLADAIDAPVLIDRPGDAPSQQISSYLAGAEGVTNVILASGTSVFTDSYVDALEGRDLDVERFAGANRYQTALQLASEAVAESNIEPGNLNIFLADGTNFPDALAAGSAAAAHSGVVLLTNGSNGLDEDTYRAIVGATGPQGPDFSVHASIIAAGGPAAAAAANGWHGTPIEVDFAHVGDNRYETAVELAETYVVENGVTENAVVASGETFADAIVGGALAGNVNGPLLLTQNNNLPNVTADFFEDSRTTWERIIALGGPESVSKNVTDALRVLDWTY